MPTEFGDAVQSAPSGQTEFGDAIAGPTPRGASNPNMLGPSPELAGIGNRVFSNLGNALKNLPSGVMAFIRHPIETTKAAVGQMDLEHPENSSGLLGMPDVLYRRYQSGEPISDIIGDIATVALPGATAERTGLAGEALSGAVKSGVSKALNAVPSTAVADVTGLISPRAANAIRVANRIKRGVQAFQNAGEEAPAAAAEAISPELQTMRDNIAKGFKYKDFAHVTDPADKATITGLADRINSGAASETPAPAATSRPGPVLVPRKFPPKNITDIARQELSPQGVTPSGQDIIRGSSNIPLSSQGAAEADRLAQATAGQFDKIYTSPLDRSQTTAKAVASTNPAAGAPEPTEALTPWYLGAHEGQPTTAVLDKMKDLIQNRPDEVPAGRGPQSTKPGQSFNDFKNEFLGHVKDQVENYEPGQKILNATHYRDTRVLQAWAQAGAPDDLSIDIPTMLEKGDVKPGDLLHLNPKTMQVKAVDDAAEPGIYFARHGATAWNAENGTANPAESVGAPGPKGVQPSPAEMGRLNAAAPPAAAAPGGGGMFLRNYDLDRIARALRTQLNQGKATKTQVNQIIASKAGVENLRDQLGLKGRYEPGMTQYLRNKVF